MTNFDQKKFARYALLSWNELAFLKNAKIIAGLIKVNKLQLSIKE